PSIIRDSGVPAGKASEGGVIDNVSNSCRCISFLSSSPTRFLCLLLLLSCVIPFAAVCFLALSACSGQLTGGLVNIRAPRDPSFFVRPLRPSHAHPWFPNLHLRNVTRVAPESASVRPLPLL